MATQTPTWEKRGETLLAKAKREIIITGFSCDKELAGKARAYAKAHNRSLSSLIAEALQEFIATRERADQLERERAAKTIVRNNHPTLSPD